MPNKKLGLIAILVSVAASDILAGTIDQLCGRGCVGLLPKGKC